MDWSGCSYVEPIPGMVSGVPLVRGSRVQADTVVGSHELGESVEDNAYSFDLDPQDIIAMLSYANQRLAVDSAGMNVLFDRNVPRNLRRYLGGNRVSTALEMRWDRTVNGALLKKAEIAGFDAFVTGDQNLSYQ